MNHNLRRERTLFVLFLGAVFVALMAALPLVTAQQTPALKKQGTPEASAGGGATAPSQSSEPGFEQADRNKDGFVDKSEAGVVPGLSANFERADRNRDGKLDTQEFAKGLEILQVRR